MPIDSLNHHEFFRSMAEVQQHGFRFQSWVIQKFFAKESELMGNYTGHWDIPRAASKNANIPERFRGLPMSVKLSKYFSPIGLSDAIRQRQIEEPFILIVGFWKQLNPLQKRIVEIEAVTVAPLVWSRLWGNLTLQDVLAIDQLVKDRSLSHHEAKQQAREWQKRVLASRNSTIVINPKIDSKGQRRVQCSLPFTSFWQLAGRAPVVNESPNFPRLFGIPFTEEITSMPRTFKKKA